MSPAADNVTDTDRINTSVADFAAAVAGGNAGPDRRRPAVPNSSTGPRTVVRFGDWVRVENVKVDGDHGTADVTVETDGAETTSAWVFTRANDHVAGCVIAVPIELTTAARAR